MEKPDFSIREFNLRLTFNCEMFRAEYIVAAPLCVDTTDLSRTEMQLRDARKNTLRRNTLRGKLLYVRMAPDPTSRRSYATNPTYGVQQFIVEVGRLR